MALRFRGPKAPQTVSRPRARVLSARKGRRIGSKSGTSNSAFPVYTWVPFSSTCLAQGRYLPKSKTMYLDFQSGRRYFYRGVSIDVWIGLLNSPSKGRFYNWRIKGRYI